MPLIQSPIKPTSAHDPFALSSMFFNWSLDIQMWCSCDSGAHEGACFRNVKQRHFAIPEDIRKVNDSESMTVTQYTWTSPEDSLEILLTHRLPTERWSKIPKFQQTLLWNCSDKSQKVSYHSLWFTSIHYIHHHSKSFHVIPEVWAWSPLGEAM